MLRGRPSPSTVLPDATTHLNPYVHRPGRLDRRSIVSFYNGNRKLPLVVLLIGLGLLYAQIAGWTTAGIAVLAAIIWIANKADMQ